MAAAPGRSRTHARVEVVCEWMAHEGLGGLPETCGITETGTPPACDRARVSPLAASALLRVWVEDLEHAPILEAHGMAGAARR